MQTAGAAVQKAGAAAVFWGCGDLLTQIIDARLTNKRGSFDYKRALVAGAYGSLFVMPVASVWYGPRLNGGVTVLKRLIPASKPLLLRWSEPQHQMQLSLLQSGLTFTCVAPIFASVYVGWNSRFNNGKNIDGIKADMQSSFVPIMTSDALFWPLADCINFRFAPPALRFYIMLAQDMLWSAILSMLSNHCTDISH